MLALELGIAIMLILQVLTLAGISMLAWRQTLLRRASREFEEMYRWWKTQADAIPRRFELPLVVPREAK